MKTSNWLVRASNKNSFVYSWIIEDKSKKDAEQIVEPELNKRGILWDSWKIFPIKKTVPEIETVRPLGAKNDYLISIVRLTGQKIQDIYGYVSMEFGDPVFDVSRVVFENGKEVTFGGEHDIAYLESYDERGLNLDDATLRGLLMQESDWDEDMGDED